MDDSNEYDNYCKILADAADYSLERSIKLVIKPHGGSSSSSTEILDCLKKVGRPNFKIWFDAGNIIYYTGKDPLPKNSSPSLNKSLAFAPRTAPNFTATS